MLFVALWLVSALLGHVGASFFTEDQLVPLLPFIWPTYGPTVLIVKELESYLEQHVSVAEAGLELLSVTIDKRALCENRSSENGTFLVLCRNDEVIPMLETIQSVNDRYNHQYCHDWVFLNDEPFDEYFMTAVSQLIPGGVVSFGQIPQDQWGPPSWIDSALAAEKQQALVAKNVYKGNSTSYRNMCRFFSGFFFNHLLLSEYKYYWRLEPGVRYFCDTRYDVFKFMRESGKKYGFTISLFEYKDTISTLWQKSKQFFSRMPLPKNNMVRFVENADASYNLCHFWLNFEIADLDFFRSPQYQAYFDHLDQAGGFYYERWGDAPIHTLAVTHLLEKSQIWWFNDMGYFHSPYLQCPLGEAFLSQRCACNPEADFELTGLSCSPLFQAIQNDLW